MKSAKEWVYGISESQHPNPELWVEMQIKDAIEWVENIQRDAIESIDPGKTKREES